MIARIIIFVFAVFGIEVLRTHAQKSFNDLQFGLEDFAPRFEPNDSNANAVIVFDRGEMTYDNRGSKLVFHRRLKILRQEGIDEWGKIIGFYPRGAAPRVEAVVFNLSNGQIEKSIMDLDFVFQSQYDKYRDKFVCIFPNLKVGSVIEYRYTVKYWDAIDPEWKFQHSIPVLRSEYKVFYPISNGLTSVLLGTIPFSHSDKKNDGREYRWVMTNLPAFKRELLMPYENQYCSTIKFWGYDESWAKTTGRLANSEIFWGIVNKSYELNSIEKKLTLGITDAFEKIKKIVGYVKETVEWNGVSDYYGTSPHKLLEDRRGTSGDINLLLASLLKKADFEVSLVLISTKDHGFVMEEVPSASQFNYVLCKVALSDKEIFLDATDRYLPYNVLPVRCSNTRGLEITQKKYFWTIIPSPPLSKHIAQIDLSLNDVKAKAKITYSNYLARSKRLDFPPKIEYGLNLGEISSHNKTEMESPLTFQTEINGDRLINNQNERIYVTPILAHKFDRIDIVLPRVYPIDFGQPIDETVVFSLVIPTGYELDQGIDPKAIGLPNHGMKYSVSSVVVNNKLVITSSFRINQINYSPAEAKQIREFFNTIIAIQNGQIVLKKKE